jgi:putative transcription factor
MAECEVCGKNVENPSRIGMDGGVFRVCENCKSLGNEMIEREAVSLPKKTGFSPEFEFEERELSTDFPDIVRKRREKLGISQKDAARRIGIQESVIKRIESHGFRPDDTTIRKIERGLGIHLVKRTKDDIMDMLDK